MTCRTPVSRLGPLAACFLWLLASPTAAEKPDEEARAEEQAEPQEDGEEREEAEPPAPRLRKLRTFSAVELGTPPHRWHGEPITLSLRDADLVEVLRSFAKLAEVNLVIDPAVKGKITVELRDVPWDQALYVILKTQGLGMEISGNVWSLTRAERLYEE